MFKIDFKEYRKYIILALMVLLAYFAYLVVKPLIVPILSGGVLAYIFYPVYKIIKRLLRFKTLSAGLMSLIIILLIAIPGFFLLNAISKETYEAYIIGKQKIGTGIITECADKTNALCNMVNSIKQTTANPEYKFYLEQGLGKLTSTLTEKITGFLLTIPKRLLELFIAFFVMYYLFKDGDKIVHKIKNIFPVDRAHQEMIINQSKKITYGVIFGVILVALIQGTVGALGFYIFGISTPLIWGIFMAFTALIPIIGTALIWLPAALLFILRGVLASESILIWKGIGLIIYGVVIISAIDNVVKPKIISTKTKVHPIIILIGVIGGIALLGFIGAIIGPLILSLLLTVIEIYKDGHRS
ncbi:AI-2E family transporter [Candidatus Woesearchaeota archaeon]|nr:AI-2E family transporter [Candidatus Woesearchaeota archaeon]